MFAPPPGLCRRAGMGGRGCTFHIVHHRASTFLLQCTVTMAIQGTHQSTRRRINRSPCTRRGWQGSCWACNAVDVFRWRGRSLWFRAPDLHFLSYGHHERTQYPPDRILQHQMQRAYSTPLAGPAETAAQSTLFPEDISSRPNFRPP